MEQIKANINSKLVICADEDFKEVLTEFLDVIQQEPRLQVKELNIQIELDKVSYRNRKNIY